MATSGNASVAVTSAISVKFSWWYNSGDQSIANNTTTVRWKMELVAGYPGAIRSSYAKNWKVSVNGTEYRGKNYIACEDNQTINLASGTTSVPHNEDGTKTFSFTFYQEIQVNFSQEGLIRNVSGSGSGTLGSIERKSTLTAGNGTLGTAQTLAVAKKASSFTHTITYACGTASGTICTKSSSTSISWTPPNDLASQAPSANAVSVVLTITTYNGNTNMGSLSVPITCDIPYTNTFAPVLAITTSDTEGYAGTYGAYVQGQSRLKVDFATAYGVYGAWIDSYKTVFDGATYTTDSVVSNPIVGTGTLRATISVTDSRGRTTQVTKDVTVLPYHYPQIPTLTVSRCDASGNAAPSGSYLAIRFETEVVSLNSKNKAMFSACYKAAGASQYTDIDTSKYNGKYSVTDGLLIVEAPSAASYEVLFSVYDNFKTTTKSAVGSSIEKVWSALKSAGKIAGFAFGKLAELAGVFDIGWQTRFTGGILQPVLKDNTDFNDVKTPNVYSLKNFSTAGYLNCPMSVSSTGTLIVTACGESGEIHQIFKRASKSTPTEYVRSYYGGAWGDWVCTMGDFVVEQGSSNGWKYRKWNSGIGECWKTYEFTTTIATAFGSLYCGNATARQTYPFVFAEKPVENVTLQAGTTQAFLYVETGEHGVNGTNSSARYNVFRPGAYSNSATFYLSFHVIGKWK